MYNEVDLNFQNKKWKIATTSLSGCFGCHTSLLDIDDRILELIKVVEFDRSPINDIKTCGTCDIGLVEGSVCNAENVHILREFRRNARVLVAVGACAINGGLPAQRNQHSIEELLNDVYCKMPGVGGNVPDDKELPLLLDKVRPISEVVRIDYFISGCPPSANAIWEFINDFISGQTPHLDDAKMRYD